MKKFLRIVLATFLIAAFLTPIEVDAEPDYSDTDYWNSICLDSSETAQANSGSCEAYISYLKTQSSSLDEKLSDIEDNISSQKSTISELETKISDLQTQVNSKQSEIDSTQSQIDALQTEIDEKQAEIDAKQADVDTIEEKVKKRMVSSQSTMRNNMYFDLLMGASTFTEFLRIASGLSAISEYDDKTMNDFVTLIEEMNAAKKELEADQATLEETKTTLESQKEELVLVQYEVKLQQEAAEAEVYRLQAEMNETIDNLDTIKANMEKAADNLNTIVASDGWLAPVVGAYVSRGVGYSSWSGTYHLGADFAVARYTSVYAVASGYVLSTRTGCYSYGDRTCGSGNGGTYGGGNQIILLVVVDGGLYAVHYCHLEQNTIQVSSGSTVSQGDLIAQVGSSGNSTGAHLHIEVKYLGNTTIESYVASWNGDLGFGAGWSYYGYTRLCRNGVGAPCRMIPEELFGYA